MRLTSILFLFIILSSANFAQAQVQTQENKFIADDRYTGYQKSLIKWPTLMPDLEWCMAQEPYVSIDTHLKKYASRVEVAEIVPQDFDMCRWMRTSSGDRWVKIARGSLIARDAQGRDLFYTGLPGKPETDCKNPSPIGIPLIPIEEKPEPPAKKEEPEPKKEPPPEEKKEEPKPPPTDKKEEPIKSRLGVTASWTPYIDSVPVQGIVETFTNREVCLDGASFDVGVAVGEPKSSFWRFTFAGMVVNDGSFTEYNCEDCNTRVKTVSRGMKVLGAKVERVFRFKKNWRFQPMASIHGGLGVVTGRAYRFGREVKASEMFESPVFPLVGAGVGLMGDIGNHWTLAVTAIGVEHPGLSYGRMQLTYWFD